MNPTVHSPRTYMPITHLSEDQANDIAVWLLSRTVKDWKGPDIPPASDISLQDLAKVHLEKILTRSEVTDYFDPSSSEAKKKRVEERLEDLKRRGADEGELAGGISDSRLKMYLGRKAINQLGCFGCHDIPGFEQAKPIGTPLNDWGKKDPERLAFEDIKAYVKSHHFIVPQLTDKDGKPIAARTIDGVTKTPYDQFFYESLIHDHREGFLHQKLMDPRSYDYNRERRWDDRLRMPQFRFARTERRPGETDAAYEARRNLEEAEAREAVMTFILGLVAEPVPLKFVNEPAGDRKHEVLGRKVLDKFNCAGCHLVRPGVYDFKITPEVKTRLQKAFETEKLTLKSDFNFLHNNAWVGSPSTRPGQLTAYAVHPRIDTDSDPGNLLSLRLVQALRFTDSVDGKDQVRDLRAYSYVSLPLSEELVGSSEMFQQVVNALERLVLAQKAARTSSDAARKEVQKEVAAAEQHLKDVVEQLDKSKSLGGTFADLLAYYLQQRDPENYKDEAARRAAVPPALLREGEKTQPAWLFQFLRNPGEIRPQKVRDKDGKDLSGVVVLRMPKFNMSDEDAMSLVNYFAAVDKVTNPSVGLDYPYMSIPQRQEDYIRRKTMDYVDRLRKDKAQYDARINALKPLWDGLWDDQGKKDLARKRQDLENDIGEAKKAVEAAKDDAAKKKRAQEELDQLQRQVDAIKDDAKQKTAFLDAKLNQWLTQEAYLDDGFRLTASRSKTEKLCLNCHRIGQEGAPQPQGPPLDLSWERLRPEWTERWIANPQRLMTYATPMPQNMPNNDVRFQALFFGSPLEQVIGVRDALMNYPRLADMPIIRRRSALEGGAGVP
jgi:hypothetical protein